MRQQQQEFTMHKQNEGHQVAGIAPSQTLRYTPRRIKRLAPRDREFESLDDG